MWYVTYYYEWQGEGTPGDGLLKSTVLSQAARQLLHSMLLLKYKRLEVDKTYQIIAAQLTS